MPICRQGSRNTLAAPCSLGRRRFMQSSALAGVAMALGLPVFSARAAGSGQTVAIIGGGIAGLTAAHELAERGFRVSVYEQCAWGGKARNISADTDTDGRLGLPDGHGFRFFSGVYNNLPDTLQRISSGNNVWVNMLQPTQTMLTASGQDAYFNSGGIPFPGSVGELPMAIHSWLQDAFFALDIPAEELAFFVSKFHVFMTSSEARRLRQWDDMSWWDYVGAATRSASYQQLIGRAPMTEAARSKEASARSVGQALEALFYADAGQGYRHAGSTVFDLSANEGWIETWCKYLADLGVSLKLAVQATQFQYANGRVTGVLAHAEGHPRTIQADWYVLAVPSEKVAALIPVAMQEADRQFANIAQQLVHHRTGGAQFFLTHAAQITMAISHASIRLGRSLACRKRRCGGRTMPMAAALCRMCSR